MTREEARKAAEVMLAYADGKEIEFCHDGENWNLCVGDDDDLLGFDFSRVEYRIKQEPTYRPFKDSKECWNEMLKHQPFGWVQNKDNKAYIDIEMIGGSPGDCGIDGIEYPKMFNDFTFADGTPFGIKEE